jgi:hypothetical protein
LNFIEKATADNRHNARVFELLEVLQKHRDKFNGSARSCARFVRASSAQPTRSCKAATNSRSHGAVPRGVSKSLVRRKTDNARRNARCPESQHIELFILKRLIGKSFDYAATREVDVRHHDARAACVVWYPAGTPALVAKIPLSCAQCAHQRID